jgi:hypothetical protein
MLAAFAIVALVTAAPPRCPDCGQAWVSIEVPADPHDTGAREAFLYVHAFNRGEPGSYPLSGTAEGIVNGERRTLTLQFLSTSRPGVRAVRKTWPDDGIWTLVITMRESPADQATALVEIGPDGQVSAVKVPTETRNGMIVAAPVAPADVAAALTARAGALARGQ